jgi:transposase
MVLPPLDSLNEADKDALIRALLARVEELWARLAAVEAENAALRRENAELRAKLNLPEKTPDNSSTPPSRGQKPSASAMAREKHDTAIHPHGIFFHSVRPADFEVVSPMMV